MTETVTREETREAQKWSGRNAPRKEDERLLRGQGSFVENIQYQHMGYVHFVRSPYAHALINRVDVSGAEQHSSVICTMAGDEVEELLQPFFQIAPEPGGEIRDYPLAVGKARFVGEPVVAVVAKTREAARDAADLVKVEYEPQGVIVDGQLALQDDAPILHEEAGSNLVWQGVYDYGDIEGALERADHVIEIDELHFHRFSSTPIETNGAVVDYDAGTGIWTMHCNNQLPGISLFWIASALGVPFNRIQLISKDIGGAFGNKINSYAYLTLLAVLARKARRPVKWTEWRSEQIASGNHGNERTFRDIKVPVMDDGTILGFQMRAIDDAGAFPRYEPLGGVIWAQVVPGCYRFKDVRVDFSQAVTNKAPVSPNRGYSRLQHLWMVERIVDVVASELGFDPVELRKHNYVAEFPHETPNGCVYDSGDYHKCLDMALDLIDYPSWLDRREEARTQGKLIGIGIGSTIDSGTNNFGQSRLINPAMPFSGNNEAANVKIDLDGSLVVTLGTVPQGQSHETTAAQVVADVLGVTPDDVTVLIGSDMQRSVYSGFSGTIASQFAVTGLSAALGAAERLRGDVKALAAAVLGGEEDEIVVANGVAMVGEDEDRSIPLAGLAGMIHFSTAEIPPGFEEVSLNRSYTYRPPFEVPDVESKTGNLALTYATQIHACVVEVDPETGAVRILDYAAVDDSGTLINPQIVEGQVHGAAAHGIGAALTEALHYDEDGQLVNMNFYDYEAATALDVPPLKVDSIESPSPFTPTGAKGMGEGGGAPLHTVCSAIQDALRQHGGGLVTDSHNPSERVYRLLHEPESSRAGLRVTNKNSEA
ncbi:MAG: xanthine dehydrogenase family protein molybdopterin-binding subunit [Rubrobacteraceae bacterium]